MSISNIEHKNIVELRKKYSWSQKQLSDYSGVSTTVINLIEKGKRPVSAKALNGFAKAFSCTAQNLLTKNFYDKDNDDKSISVPLYDVKTSAGSGYKNFSEDIVLHIPLSKFNITSGLVLQNLDKKQNRFAFIQIAGDSMYNQQHKNSIKDGDLALIDFNVNVIETYKQILLFRDAANNSYIKEIYIPSYGKINIESYNASYPSWKPLDEKDLHTTFGGDINIIGKVIWNGSRIEF